MQSAATHIAQFAIPLRFNGSNASQYRLSVTIQLHSV